MPYKRHDIFMDCTSLHSAVSSFLDHEVLVQMSMLGKRIDFIRVSDVLKMSFDTNVKAVLLYEAGTAVITTKQRGYRHLCQELHKKNSWYLVT